MPSFSPSRLSLFVALGFLVVRIHNLESCLVVTSTPTETTDKSNATTSETTSIWKKVGIDLEGETTDDLFGYAVALSADGRRLAVGAIWSINGQARVFECKWYPRMAIEQDLDNEEERWIQV